MVYESIITSLSSKDPQEQLEGINKIKGLLTNFDISNEYILINTISFLLESGSDKNIQPEVEYICDEFIKIIPSFFVLNFL